MNNQMLKENEVCNHIVSLKCMSWTGIIAGALIAVGLSFLFSIFAAALGLAAFQTSPEGVTTMAVGGYVGMVIGTIAIMYFAGWVAGYAGRSHHCMHHNLGAVYGLTAWCLGLVIMVVLATQTSQFVSGSLYNISNDVVTTQLFNDINTPVIVETVATPKQMQQINITDKEAAKLLTLSLFLTFALFFIGAISSALGGYRGLKPCDSECNSCCDSGCSSCCKK